MPSVDQLVVWIVVGLLGGGLAGALTTWERGRPGSVGASASFAIWHLASRVRS